MDEQSGPSLPLGALAPLEEATAAPGRASCDRERRVPPDPSPRLRARQAHGGRSPSWQKGLGGRAGTRGPLHTLASLSRVGPRP